MQYYRFLGLVAGLLTAPVALMAQDATTDTPPVKTTPPPFPDFEARWVKPPKPGTVPKITIQIEPAAPAPKPAPDAPAATAPTELAYAWYWEKISPDLANSTPGRLGDAVNQLQHAPVGAAVPTPRLQRLGEISALHGTDILLATIGTKVSPALVLAVISVESGGQVDAESSAGAQGLMQLIPATAERFGVTDANDPVQNIGGGVAYLDWLMGEFNNDPVMVLAAYNAGEGAVRKNQGVPPYDETRAYVPKVLAAWQVARGLCKTPPELISDGCVFDIPIASN